LRLDGIPVPCADIALPAAATQWRLSAGQKQHLRIVLADMA